MKTIKLVLALCLTVGVLVYSVLLAIDDQKEEVTTQQ